MTECIDRRGVILHPVTLEETNSVCRR